MTSHPEERGGSKMARRLLAVGLMLAMGYAFGVLTLGGCAGASWPSEGKLPERVVDKLADCGRQGPTPLQSVSYDLAFIAHVTEEGAEIRVDDVMLKDSTVHLPEVEACMIDALYGMRAPLDTLALRRRNLAPDAAVAPEARALFGQAQMVLFFEAAALVVAGYATYTVVVTFLRTKNHTKRRPPPPTPETEAPPKPDPSKPGPELAGEPKTTDPPPPPPPSPPARRYPNQKCDDGELDRLEKEMHQRCDVGYAAICGGGVSKSKKPLIPCSAIRRSIEQRQICLKHRWLVQEKCFGGVPDAAHKGAIEQVELGIKACEVLKLTNCAKGHPMAGL